MAARLLSRRRVLFALAAGGVVAGKRLEGNTAVGATDDKIDLAKVPVKVFEGNRPRDKKEITVSVSADGKEIEIDEGWRKQSCRVTSFMDQRKS